MVKVENIEVFNFEGAIRGMRNPLNSWEKSDSSYTPAVDYKLGEKIKHNFRIGEKDLALMRRLYKGGTEHRKFMRQIMVSMDITCNHFWWAEFDTYKVGVTRNSCSKMHKVHIKEFVPDDFSHEGLTEVGGEFLEHFEETLATLERLRVLFNETGEKKYWRALLELLPMGYNIKATITMNYENAASIIRQRKNHKVFEWYDFCYVLRTQLPYLEEIINEKGEN